MAMDKLKKEVQELAMAELQRANARFPLFASDHEAYAVTLEEVEEAREELQDLESQMKEFWDDVRGKDNLPFPSYESPMDIYRTAIKLACEAIQAAAMLMKCEESRNAREDAKARQERGAK